MIALFSIVAITDFILFFSGVDNRFVFLICGVILVVTIVLNAYVIKLKRMSNKLGKTLEELGRDLQDEIKHHK